MACNWQYVVIVILGSVYAVAAETEKKYSMDIVSAMVAATVGIMVAGIGLVMYMYDVNCRRYTNDHGDENPEEHVHMQIVEVEP